MGTRFRGIVATAALLTLYLSPTTVALAAPDPVGCRVVPVDADAPLRSAEARSAFGVDGTGVTVGVVSDSFATMVDPPSTWDHDIEVGSLPGAGNPCGRLNPVTVIADSAPGTDEGRAMLQLVHGVAPGADLMFASSGADQFAMAANILALADRGADIIVDDVTEFAEPTYQVGPIELAAQEVRSRGVVYLSAASNFNQIGSAGTSVGRQIGSWESLAYRPIDCPTLIAGILGAGFDCMDFDPGPDADPTMDFGVGPEVPKLIISLDWAEPWYGVQQQFVPVVLRDGALYGSADDFDPEMPAVVWGARPDPADPVTDLTMVVVRKTPTAVDAPALRVRLGFEGDGLPYPTYLEYDRSTDTDTVGPGVTGHNGGVGVISVAAARAATPTEPEPFSSHGPRTLLFGPVDGETAAAPLADPEVLALPDITSIDGVQNTFLGPETPAGTHVFLGTSAASPNAAAVIALARELRPDAEPDELEAALLATATPIPSPFDGVPTDQVTGAGLVNATAFLGALQTVPGAPVDVVAAAGPDLGTVVLTFGAPLLDGGAPVTGYSLSCSSDGFTGGVVDAPGSPVTVAGLRPGTSVACQVAAVNAKGAGPTVSTSFFPLPAAAPSEQSSAAPSETSSAAPSETSSAAPTADRSDEASLAATGTAPGSLTATALLLLALGGVLVRVASRRRKA